MAVLLSHFWVVPLLYIGLYAFRWYGAAQRAFPEWTPALEKRHGGIRNQILIWGSLPFLTVGFVKYFIAPGTTSPMPEAGTLGFHLIFAAAALMSLRLLFGLYLQGGTKILLEPPANEGLGVISIPMFAQMLGPIVAGLFVFNLFTYYGSSLLSIFS